MKDLTVTITGADESVEPFELSRFAGRYDFLEWGILLSQKRVGTPRYPDVTWLKELWRITVDKPMRMSAHLCGTWAREVIAGLDNTVQGPAFEMFQRVQLNGYASPIKAGLKRIAATTHFEFILQVRAPGDIEQAQIDASLLPNASLLFDPSGGEGISHHEWHRRAPFHTRMGFAGGITPENVEQVIAAIGDPGKPTWIDMESGVRTDDRLDFDKVREVLETVKRIREMASARADT